MSTFRAATGSLQSLQRHLVVATLQASGNRHLVCSPRAGRRPSWIFLPVPVPMCKLLGLFDLCALDECLLALDHGVQHLCHLVLVENLVLGHLGRVSLLILSVLGVELVQRVLHKVDLLRRVLILNEVVPRRRSRRGRSPFPILLCADILRHQLHLVFPCPLSDLARDDRPPSE